MIIETVVGCLAEVYKLLQPGSILHVDELMKERRLYPITSDGNLRNQWLYTADGLIYLLHGENRTPTLAITRGSSNPLFQYSTIDEYCKQLIKNHNYRPTADETSRALSAPDTVVVDLTTLRLQKYNEEFSYFAIDPQNYNLLNPEEKKLAQRIYGKGKDFVQTMKMLADADIRETRVHVLNPEYVCRYATENSLGRASWLYYFNNYSFFYANDRNVNYRSRARGVRREDVARSAAAPES